MTTTMQNYPDIDVNIDGDTMDLGSEAGNIYMNEDFPVNPNSGNNLDVDQDVELQDARSETARGSQTGEPDYFMADLDEINYSDEEIVDADEDAQQPNALADAEITDAADQQDILDVETELVSRDPDNSHANEETHAQTDKPSNPPAASEKPVDWDQDFIDYSDDEAGGVDVHEASVADEDTIPEHNETAQQTDGPGGQSESHGVEQDSIHTTEQEHEESAPQDFDETIGQSYDDNLGQDFGVFDEQAYDGYGEHLDEFAAQDYDDAGEAPNDNGDDESHQNPSVSGDAHATAELEDLSKEGPAVQESEDPHEQEFEGSVNNAQEDVGEQDFEDFTQDTYEESTEQPLEDDVGQDEENTAHGESNEFDEFASEETLGHAPEEEGKEGLNNFDFEQAFDENTEIEQPFEHANEEADQYNSNEFAETTYDESATLAGFAEENGHEDSVDVNDEDTRDGFGQTAEFNLDEAVNQLNDNVEIGLSNHESIDAEQPHVGTGAVSLDETAEGVSADTTEHEHEHEHDHNSTAEAGWDEADDGSANSGDQASSAEHEDSEHHSTAGTGDGEDDLPLHPVSVRYDGHEMMLFPLQTSATNHTYLLSDESLAHGNILELFAACRECLGDSIGENIELRLELPGLKLELSEDYILCSTLSLSKIINIYKQLKAADGEDDPPPLEMILKKRKHTLAARLAWLEECADTNLGYLASQEQDETEQPAENEQHNEESDEEYGDESNSNDGEDQHDEHNDKRDQHGSKRTFVDFEEEEEEAVKEETSSPKRVKTTE